MRWGGGENGICDGERLTNIRQRRRCWLGRRTSLEPDAGPTHDEAHFHSHRGSIVLEVWGDDCVPSLTPSLRASVELMKGRWTATRHDDGSVLYCIGLHDLETKETSRTDEELSLYRRRTTAELIRTRQLPIISSSS
jgi:hypothetical protein